MKSQFGNRSFKNNLNMINIFFVKIVLSAIAINYLPHWIVYVVFVYWTFSPVVFRLFDFFKYLLLKLIMRKFK